MALVFRLRRLLQDGTGQMVEIVQDGQVVALIRLKGAGRNTAEIVSEKFLNVSFDVDGDRDRDSEGVLDLRGDTDYTLMPCVRIDFETPPKKTSYKN